MEQTAVEWLFLMINNPNKDQKFANKLLDKAKEMEKQQIIDAVEWGNRKGYEDHKLTCINNIDEQYYNEKFKNNDK